MAVKTERDSFLVFLLYSFNCFYAIPLLKPLNECDFLIIDCLAIWVKSFGIAFITEIH